MHKTQLSVNVGRLLTRTAVVLGALGALALGCGGGGGNDESFQPPVAPGFFVGTTHEGEPMSIEVDSIGAVFVSCGGAGFEYFAAYDPPEPISVNGDFGVNIADGLRFIAITGAFSSNDHIVGTISGDPFCDGDFDVRRCTPAADPKCQDNNPKNHIPDGIQPTPTATPTTTPIPTKTATPIPTSTVSSSASGTTPTTSSPAKTPTPEASPSCGNGIIDAGEDEECDGTNLGGATCISLGNTGGTLVCDEDCLFDDTNCD